MAIIRKYGYALLFILLVFVYALFSIEFERTDTLLLFLGFGSLLVLTVLLYRQIRAKHWMFVFLFGCVFRLLFLFPTPHLSDDYFRFTWDGELQKDGISSFAFLPSEYENYFSDSVQLRKYKTLFEAQNQEFPEGMNSKNYHSIYPAVNQFVFLSASTTNSPNEGNIVVMRLWIFLAEIASFFVLRTLLTKLKKPHLVAYYWLHPLIVIELIGNIHFEGMAIAFLLVAIYAASRNNTVMTALSAALAIMSKLTPLFFLGALVRNVSVKRLFLISGLTILFTIALFSTVIDLQTFANFKQSFGLYFAWFSFNSGVYYAFRELGLLFGMGDFSSLLSLCFPFITMLIFGYITFFRKDDIATKLLLFFSVYFLFSPIVHPWYITVLIPLGILSGKLFPLLWSVLVFGTYVAYREPYAENLPWVFFEYALVITVFLAEMRSQKWALNLQRKLYGN